MTGDPKQPEAEAVESPKSEAVKEPAESTALVVSDDSNLPTVVDEQVTELQEQLAEAKDKTNEVLFYAILTIVIILDLIGFSFVSSTAAVLFLAFLECLLLLGLAKRLGVEQPAILLAGLARSISDALRKKS